MENSKKLIVNAATCDIRNITEETLKNYESICINSAIVISSPEAQALIGRCGNVTMSASSVYVAEEDVKVFSINGNGEIGPENIPTQKTLLTVNGSLTVKPCDPVALDNYVYVSINGRVLCPKSLSGFLSGADVNGSVELYPDGAVLLKSNAAIDRVFALRAKNSIYWAPRLLFLDTAVDAETLRSKGARFEAKKVIIAESLVEKLIDLISEEADVKIVPDGTAFINDDAVLDENLIMRYGTKLYINGDFDVKDGAEQALPKLEYVSVNGNVAIYKEFAEQFFTIKPEYDEIKIIDRDSARKYDIVIEDRALFKIDRALLDRCPGGVLISDCALLKIAPDVPGDLITERLSVKDCGVIRCSPEQEVTVSLAAEDYGHICTDDNDADGYEGENDGIVNTINASDYKF